MANSMRTTRTVFLGLAVLVISAASMYAADNPFMGTWKLDEGKSKIGAGAPKVTTVVYETAGDNIKITADGTFSDGKSLHDEWTGKMDGKDYPVATSGPDTGAEDVRSYTKVNDRTLRFTNKKGGKVITTGTVKLAADGKSRTVSRTDVDAKGKKINSTQIYDKQ
jgi:hypothetical protein